jgi:hypothetical protein
MRSHERPKERPSLRALVALSDEFTAVASPLHDRRPRLTRPETWSRTNVQERLMSSDRDDPTFDYAAN